METNGVALDVLEASVNVDRTYQFTATYFGATLGYFINAINGTSSYMSCFWFFFTFKHLGAKILYSPTLVCQILRFPPLVIQVITLDRRV